MRYGFSPTHFLCPYIFRSWVQLSTQKIQNCCSRILTPHIQYPKMNIIHLVINTNEMWSLLEQTASLKCCHLDKKVCMLTIGLRSFQRGVVGLCRSKGYKPSSYQIWRSGKNPAARPNLHNARVAQDPENGIILKVLQATTCGMNMYLF